MIQTLSFIIIFCFGYYIGLQRHEQDLKNIKKRVGRARAIITGVKHIGTPSGVVYRPTAQELRDRKKKSPEDEAFMEGIKNPIVINLK